MQDNDTQHCKRTAGHGETRLFHRGLLSSLVYFTSLCHTFPLVIGRWSLVVGRWPFVRSPVVSGLRSVVGSTGAIHDHAYADANRP